MAVTGSDYTSAPTVTIASEAHDFNAQSAVEANGQITITGHTFVVGDQVTYSDNGFYWQIDGLQEPCDLCNELGGDDWDYYD